MHILLTGGTGLIGSALCRRWVAEGHQLTVLSRRPQDVPRLCTASVRGIARLEDYGDGPLDAVVNLAGQPVADRPWTRARKASLLASRVALTERLVAWLGTRSQRPALLLNGSAVGWYGDGGERELREDAPPGQGDFASELCQAWEDAARDAEALGIRVVLLRIGLVMSPRGGFCRACCRSSASASAAPWAADASGGRGFIWKIKSPRWIFFCGWRARAVPIMRARRSRPATPTSPAAWAVPSGGRSGCRRRPRCCGFCWGKCRS